MSKETLERRRGRKGSSTYRKRLASSIKGRFSSSVSSFHSAPGEGEREIEDTCLEIFNVKSR